MILAGIDIGTNTLRLLIADIGPGSFHEISSDRRITRLGQNLDQSGLLSTEAMKRSLEALVGFQAQARHEGACQVSAIGTSALRNAANAAAFIQRVKEETGLAIRVVTGEEEARLTLLGVAQSLAEGETTRGKSLLASALIIDIGGGSTELIRGNENGVGRAVSIDLGSVRLTERFLHTDPVKADEVAQMHDAIDRELACLPNKNMAPDAALTLVGIAGTFTTLAAMEKKLTRYAHGEVHGSVLTLPQVRRQLDRLKRRTIAERRRMIGLEPQRADVIFAGASLMERIMTRYHAERVIVSDQGVRYGLLHEAARPI